MHTLSRVKLGFSRDRNPRCGVIRQNKSGNKNRLTDSHIFASCRTRSVYLRYKGFRDSLIGDAVTLKRKLNKNSRKVSLDYLKFEKKMKEIDYSKSIYYLKNL